MAIQLIALSLLHNQEKYLLFQLPKEWQGKEMKKLECPLVIQVGFLRSDWLMKLATWVKFTKTFPSSFWICPTEITWRDSPMYSWCFTSQTWRWTSWCQSRGYWWNSWTRFEYRFLISCLAWYCPRISWRPHRPDECYYRYVHIFKLFLKCTRYRSFRSYISG